MLVVLGQCHNVSLGGYLEAAATAHFDVGALKLTDQSSVALEHGNVKPIAVAVADKNVTGITDVDAVWVVGEVLAANTAQELTFLTEYDHAVTLA